MHAILKSFMVATVSATIVVADVWTQATPIPAPAHSVRKPKFRSGDFYLYYVDPDGNGQHISRVDGASGQLSVIASFLNAEDSQAVGPMAYDPFRDRIILGRVGFYTTFQEMIALAPDGSHEEIASFAPRCVAPTGDGRIYWSQQGPIQFLDAQNNVHLLLSLDGMSSVASPVGTTGCNSSAYFEPTTNSLFILTCDGTSNVMLSKFPLSPDGSQLSGTPLSRSIHYGAGAGQGQIGAGPNGSLLLTEYVQAYCLDGVPDVSMVRLVDPVSLADAPYTAGTQKAPSFITSAGPCGVYDFGRGKAAVPYSLQRTGLPPSQDTHFVFLAFYDLNPIQCSDPSSAFFLGYPTAGHVSFMTIIN